MTRILQVSDTHIVADGERAYGVVDTSEALERAVSYLTALLPKISPIDLVIVTGDLTDFGTAEEYSRFQRLMAPLDLPYLAIPGNHDDRETMRGAFASHSWMPASGPVNWAVAFDDVLVIGLDTLVTGQPHGLLANETLSWLGDRLEDHRDIPALIGMHHPPFEIGIGHMDRQALRAPKALLDVLAGCPQQITLTCGHVHRLTTTQLHGHMVMTAPSPSHSVALDLRDDAPANLELEPGGVLLHDALEGRLVSQLILIGPHGGPYPFF